MAFNILVINPGSTSDDIGYYRGDKSVFEVTVRYSIADLEPYEGKNVTEQLPLRRKLILDYLLDHHVPLAEIDAVIGRGGFIRSVEGGVYGVNEKMVVMLRHIKRIINYKGEYTAMREARHHAGYYTKGIRNGASYRREISTFEHFEQLEELAYKIAKENE